MILQLQSLLRHNIKKLDPYFANKEVKLKPYLLFAYYLQNQISGQIKGLWKTSSDA